MLLMKLELPSGVDVEIKVYRKMQAILGKKIGMTSIFSEDGKNIPCTVIEVGPCVVTQIKTVETDGYNAVQILDTGETKEKHSNKALMGHL